MKFLHHAHILILTQQPLKVQLSLNSVHSGSDRLTVPPVMAQVLRVVLVLDTCFLGEPCT